MYHIKDDRREVKSANLICEGMLACLKEKGVDRISVSDLQQRSTVSRATFYRHFDCQDDVLALLCDKGFHEIFASVSESAPLLDVWGAVFDYWAENSIVLEALVDAHRVDILFESMKRSAARQPSHTVLQASPEKYDYWISVLTGGMAGVLSVWVKHGKKESMAEVKEMLNEAFVRILSAEMIGSNM